MQNQNTGYGFTFYFTEVASEDQKEQIEGYFRRISLELLEKFPSASGFGTMNVLDQDTLDIQREVYGDLMKRSTAGVVVPEGSWEYIFQERQGDQT